jgi:hypothetical protein
MPMEFPRIFVDGLKGKFGCAWVQLSDAIRPATPNRRVDDQDFVEIERKNVVGIK